MKKLIVMASAIAIAAFAQAAQVQWSFTGVAADPVGTAWTGYHAYLCDASVYTASVLAEDLAAGKFEKLSTSGFVQATAGTVQQGTASFAKIDSTYKGGDYTVGDTKTFYTLVLNDVGDKATYFTISADATKKVPESGFLSASYTNLTAGAQIAWTEVAPEPTSGLMMLLGMGVLALRRRRA